MRRRTTAAAVALAAAAALTLGTPSAAGAADLDCSDFATQAEAQAALIAAPEDPDGLDTDDDGSACELLPARAGSTEVFSEDQTVLGAGRAAQVSTRPVGAVAAGDGSTEDRSALPWAVGGLAFAGAAGAAAMARRAARGAA